MMDVTGFNDLYRTLDDLPREVQTKAGVSAVRRASTRFRKRLLPRIPLGTAPTRKSRRLKSGKQVFYDYGRWRDNLRVRKVPAGLSEPHEIAYRVTSGAAFWGWIYEMGSVHQPARPIVRPAFDGDVAVMIDDMRDGLESFLIRRERAGLAE